MDRRPAAGPVVAAVGLLRSTMASAANLLAQALALCSFTAPGRQQPSFCEARQAGGRSPRRHAMPAAEARYSTRQLVRTVVRGLEARGGDLDLTLFLIKNIDIKSNGK